jgi:hypothetical protein
MRITPDPFANQIQALSASLAPQNLTRLLGRPSLAQSTLTSPPRSIPATGRFTSQRLHAFFKVTKQPSDTHLGGAALIAISIPLLQQLTYLIPMPIPSALRWILSLTIIAAIAALHVNLLWIVPTLVWTFIVSVFLLRALLPSATDHKMLGYLNALARPPIDNSFAPFNPNLRPLPPTRSQVTSIAGREKGARQAQRPKACRDCAASPADDRDLASISSE